MGGDYTRFTHKPEKRYSGVLMQQGRVQLDADWNEETEITKQRWQVQATDTFGPCAVPKTTTPGAFKVTRIDGPPLDLKIPAGRMYVDGLLAEALRKDKPISYLHQPFYPVPPPLPTSGQAIVYLDVWEREVTYIEDPDLLEKALGGPDTTTRTQTVWQVKVKATGKAVTCGMNLSEFSLSPSGGRLSTRAISPPASDDPCILSPSGGYRGLENRLYRVEIHHGGGLPGLPRPRSPKHLVPVRFISKDQVAIGPETVNQPGWIIGQSVELFSQRTEDEQRVPTFARIKAVDAERNVITLDKDILSLANDVNIQMRPVATFKWSRENASVVSSVHEIKISGSQTVLKVSRIGRDKILRFHVDDWVEVTDDYRELLGMPGEMARIVKPPDETNLTITLDRAIPSPGNLAFGSDEREIRARHTRLRRWDQQLNVDGDGLLPISNDWIKLEDGVEIKFDLKEEGTFHVADYWTFAARTADASVEPLDQEPPRGILHHCCQLAAWKDVLHGEPEDCRTLWPPECGKGEGCCTVVVRPGESIQAAIDGLPDNGGFICLKTGIHTVTEPLLINKSNVVLHGESPGTQVIRTDGINMLAVAVASDVAIEGIQFIFKHSRTPVAPPKGSTIPVVIPAIMILNACKKTQIRECSVGVQSEEPVPAIGLWIERSVETTLEGNHIYSVIEGIVMIGGGVLETSRNIIEAPVYQGESSLLPAGDYGIRFVADRRSGGFDFGQMKPGTQLPNPYTWASVTFKATDQASNRIIDQYPQPPNQDGKGELDLKYEMTVTGFLPSYEVRATVVHYHSKDRVTLEAYKGSQLVGSQTAGPNEGQVYELVIEGEEIDRVVFKSPSGEASLLEFTYSFTWGTIERVKIHENRIENFCAGVSLCKEVIRSVISANEIVCPAVEVDVGPKFCAIDLAGPECLVKENRIENHFVGVRTSVEAKGCTIAANRILRFVHGKGDQNKKGYAIVLAAPSCRAEGNYINLTHPSHGGINLVSPLCIAENNLLESQIKAPEDILPLGIYLCQDEKSLSLPVTSVIRNNQLLGIQNGIWIDGSSSKVGLSDLRVTENKIIGYKKARAGVAIFITNAIQTVISDNFIRNVVSGISLTGGSHNQVLRNKLSDGRLGFFGQLENDLVLSGNTVENMEQYGIGLDSCVSVKMTQDVVRWCGFEEKLPFAYGIGFLKTNDICIESCEVLYTGSGLESGKEIFTQGATSGIYSLNGTDIVVRGNRVLGALNLSPNQNHSAVTLLGYPESEARGAVEISHNHMEGIGYPNLARLPGEFKDDAGKQTIVKFRNVDFSNNECTHVVKRVDEKSATVLLTGDFLSIVGNHIKADDRKCRSFRISLPTTYLTAVSNLSSGPWDIAIPPNQQPQQIKPTKYDDFNHIGVL